MYHIHTHVIKGIRRYLFGTVRSGLKEESLSYLNEILKLTVVFDSGIRNMSIYWQVLAKRIIGLINEVIVYNKLK